jgi:hypothetical protein
MLGAHALEHSGDDYCPLGGFSQLAGSAADGM